MQQREDSFDDPSDEEYDTRDLNEDHTFVLGGDEKPKYTYSHPTRERIHQLWRIFTENVDPLTKIVHVPSLEPAIHKATSNLKGISKGFEALLFSIYGAAVMSMKDEDCTYRLGESRELLLSQYIAASKQALSRANFMGTTSIVVLQALVLHILAVRNVYSPRTVWTLTGVAVRLAEGMGLHCEAGYSTVSPFEAEIRRRIWWQLKLDDLRAAELGGLPTYRGISSEDDTCKPPANLNDNELWPEMPIPEKESNKLTDMTFVLLRVELATFRSKTAARFSQKDRAANHPDEVAPKSDSATKENLVKEIEEILELKFLRYCDPLHPLQLSTMLIARYSLNIIRFFTHHPSRWPSQEETPKSEREYLWKTSLALLEQYSIMQSDSRLQCFAWNAAYFLKWHIFIHVLDCLRAYPSMPDIDKAWRLVQVTYENNPEIISNTNKPVHVAVGNLCLKAFNARETTLMQQQKSVTYAPDFIIKLRQQREVAKARKEARDARKRIAESSTELETSQVIEVTRRRDPKMSLSNADAGIDEPLQEQSMQVTNLEQTNYNDPFWPTSDLLDGIPGFSDDAPGMDINDLLAQDFVLGDESGQSIDWMQWEAWLRE